MNQRHAQPTSSGRRQHHGQGKASRPGINRRVHSYHNAHSQTHAGSKAHPTTGKKAGWEEVRQAEEEEEMAGLPQFCTYCDSQIVHPGNSTLYCSRACQRRDSAKPTPIEPVVSPAFISAPSYFDVPQPDILPQRSPTVLRPLSSTFSDLYLPESGSSDDYNDEVADRSKRLSDATNYHNRPDSSLSTSPLTTRPRTTRSSTSTLPSLSHTPSSSVGTATSFTSSSRPFPPRHSIKSADLVIPIVAGPSSADASVKSEASTLTSFHAAEAEYPKQPDWRHRQGSATGSLRQLFRHEAVAGSPPLQGSRGLK